MSGPSLMDFNPDQIRKMMDDYNNALEERVTSVYKKLALECAKAIEESSESQSSIARISGVHDMSIRNLKTGELGQGVGLKAALRVLTHLGYDVEITVTKRS